MASKYRLSKNSMPNQILQIHKKSFDSIQIRCMFPSIYCCLDHASQYDTRETFWDTQLERLIWNLFNILSVLQLVIFFSLEVTFQCSCLQDILYDLTFHHHLTFTNLTTLCLD